MARIVLPRAGNTYCLSDLHIHPKSADGMFDRMFTDRKAEILIDIALEAAHGSGRGGLVCVGDVFDLTGVTPPAAGLDEFFTELFGRQHGINVPQRKSVEDHLQEIADAYPQVMNALGAVAREGDLVFIKGNHDCDLFDAVAERKLATLLGVAETDIRFETDSFRLGSYLFVHGHAYDGSNDTRGGSANRGAAITSALYHAVMPALAKLGVSADIVSAIPAVRPEEGIVDGLEAILGAEKTALFLQAFVRLLVANHYWPNAPIALAEFLAGKFVTPDIVRREMADDSSMDKELRARAAELLAVQGVDGASVVVMGHTHDCDYEAVNYVNLGTWIDFLGGLKTPDLAAVTRQLPVLRITSDGTAALFDATNLKNADFDLCPQLWKWPRRK